MKSLRYQQEAVNELVNKTIDLLRVPGKRKKLVFTAPTGSGKTVMASEMLRMLNVELQENANTPCSEVAYIWIAPNKLHEQSYFKMKSYFTETMELRPVIFDDLDHSVSGFIQPNDILFINWESINKDNALMARETEMSSSLYDIAQRTQEEQGIPIIVIIDEEHLFAGRQANRSEQVLQRINPKVEVRISATPITHSDYQVSVLRENVIAEQMIKKGVVLNPALNFDNPNITLNQHLIDNALKKRDELAEAYRALGVNINPLLLIQLPNDSSEAMSAEDTTIRNEVEQYLEQKNITVTNAKLAVWLSGEKKNLDGIEELDNLTDVLLFKQAIAMGWDCPRAAVLLIFRKIESFTFTAQTVGRILRMPEQKFYDDDRLNKGYVYTNLSKNIIEIVRDDMDYISSFHAVRRDNLNNVQLKSEYRENPAVNRKRLGSDFKRHLTQVIEREWGVKNTKTLFSGNFQKTFDNDNVSYKDIENSQMKNREAVERLLTFKIKDLSISVVEGVQLTDEIGQIAVNDKAEYKRSSQEINKLYNDFCSKLIGSKFEKVSVTTLGYVLKEVLENLFGLQESDIAKFVLNPNNSPKFEDVIANALDEYLEKLIKKQKEKIEKSFVQYDWEVPADRLYSESSHRVREDVENHALVPFVEQMNASNPETRFTAFLENHKEYIDWWYKNGDSGKQNYAISYTNFRGIKSLFYIDFVVRMKNGQVFLFDTKSKESDRDAVEKHNALIDYIHSEQNADKHLLGGIIIEQNSNWKYSQTKIKDTANLSEWKNFYPEEWANT